MKIIKHVIFIAYQPVTLRFKDNFYIDRLIKEGFEVEYWDLSELLIRSSVLNHQLSFIEQKKISTYRQLEKSITVYKHTAIFIFDITYSAVSYKIFRTFSRQQCTTGFFGRGSLPSSSVAQSVRIRFLSKFKAFTDTKYLRRTILNQCAIMAKRLNLVKPYSFVFYAGSQGVASIGYGYTYGKEKSIQVPVNSFDFDTYLKLKKQGPVQAESPYCVFLDNYLPFHPDFELLQMPVVNARNYYDSLNLFFDAIENAYKIKVVIAAHPKSEYETRKSYGERVVIKNKTPELVKDAAFVLAHLSTSISFAVLFKKPLMFIYNNEIKKTYPYTQYPQILNFSKILNAACLNVDECLAEQLKPLSVDEAKYEQYKYNFLTNPESENELSEEIVIRSIKTIRPGLQ